MTSNAKHLANLILYETGLDFGVEEGVDENNDTWYLLSPTGVNPDYAFTVRITIRWRRIVLVFEPGKFAGDLLVAMGRSDETGRAAFRSVLSECANRGASIDFRVNDRLLDPQSGEIWTERWSRLTLILQKQFDSETTDTEQLTEDAFYWSRLFVAAVLTLVPIESNEKTDVNQIIGFAEGGSTTNQSTHYERDRRNRAAAIAIWGSHCQACGLDFGTRYGDVAAGFIEVHHTTPVSELEPSTVVDPSRDLVPLCSNCHAVAHRRNPPFSVKEIQTLIQSNN